MDLLIQLPREISVGTILEFFLILRPVIIQRLGLTCKYWNSVLHLESKIWEKSALEISAAQYRTYKGAIPLSFFSWQAELEESLILERRSAEIANLGAKQALTEAKRRCFNCGKMYLLSHIFEAESNCRSHPVPLYWRHEYVHWDFGGDSWDFKGFPCCGTNPDNQFDDEPSGCLNTVHMDRLDALADEFDWEFAPDIQYLPPYWHSTGKTQYRRSLKDADEETTEEGDKVENVLQSAICSDCHHQVCLCDDTTFIFDFDERDLDQR